MKLEGTSEFLFQIKNNNNIVIWLTKIDVGYEYDLG